ncbi:WLM domain-containing protein [Gammaproteobacteria bacterium]
MINTQVVLIILVIIVICYLLYKYKLKKYLSSTRVLSRIDNRYYTVRNTDKKQEAADKLAIINFKIIQLIHSLSNDDNSSYKENIGLLNTRYDPDSLCENIDQSDTSFTINKGESIHFCLTTRDDESNIYDNNIMLFVAIHELAHIGCHSVGHTPEFNKFFQYILSHAVELGIYKYQNYYKKNEEYCGININSTPLVQ